MILIEITYYKMVSNKNTVLTVKKCLEQTDLIDFYITKNIIKIIKNSKSYNFLKSNLFLLAITNKNNKNSLIILLESGKYNIVKELIELDYNLLNYKNINENNIFKTLLAYEYFYDFICKKILELEREFIIKIITEQNNLKNNFIDNLILLLNLNVNYFLNLNKQSHNLIKKMFQISKNIYLLDHEKKTLLITKLCRFINNQDYLLNIIKFIDLNNFDIYPDSNMLNCIDYLILNEYYDVMNYLLDKINYIEFVNIDDNLIFNLLENSQLSLKIKSNIIFKILHKSNISKFKNNKNQNIFFYLVKEFDFNINILIDFKDIISIHEQDIYGNSLFNLIKKKYSLTDLKLIKKEFENIKTYNLEFEKICKKINIKNKLIKSDIGIFTSNIIHNMLYTITLLNFSHKNLTIPYYIQSDDYKNYQEQLINMSNNEKNIINYLKLIFNNFNTWTPHLILWKNKYNYWIDPNLINSIKKLQNLINFVYVKLSVYLLDNTNTRHSNAIIIDNINKIVERFEPYGEMIFTNSNDINMMIQTQIAQPLGYKFVFVQPYPGFQSRSDEFARYNKSYGDPNGFCLAWSFLYIHIKLELYINKSKINPIDFINWYIINKFSKDFNIDENTNKTNKYILFIRYFAVYLDTEKNKLITKYNLDPSLSYQADLEINYHNKIIENINNDLKNICKIL